MNDTPLKTLKKFEVQNAVDYVCSGKNFGCREFAFILPLSLLLADLGLFSDVYDRCCTRYPLFAYKLQGLPVSFDSLTCEGKFRSAPAFGFCPTVK